MSTLREAAEEFCRRVEAGEIRSKRSYAAFKAALAAPVSQEPVAWLVEHKYRGVSSQRVFLNEGGAFVEARRRTPNGTIIPLYPAPQPTEGEPSDAEARDKAQHKLELWFFRDLSDEQRLSLFSIFDYPVHEIDRVHGHQRKCLRRVIAALLAAKSKGAKP